MIIRRPLTAVVYTSLSELIRVQYFVTGNKDDPLTYLSLVQRFTFQPSVICRLECVGWFHSRVRHWWFLQFTVRSFAKWCNLFVPIPSDIHVEHHYRPGQRATLSKYLEEALCKYYITLPCMSSRFLERQVRFLLTGLIRLKFPF